MSGNLVNEPKAGHHANHHAENGASQNGDMGYQGSGSGIARFTTAGGHPLDNSQPAFPVYHRRFANPAPLGLLSYVKIPLFVQHPLFSPSSFVHVLTAGPIGVCFV